MADPSARIVAKPPPTGSFANRQIAIGAVSTVFALGGVGTGAAYLGLPLLLFGGFFLYSGALLKLSGSAVSALNTAYGAAQEGRVLEAERILDEMEGRFQLGYIRR